MAKEKLGTVVRVLAGLALAGMMVLLLVEVRRLEERLALLEDAAGARPGKPERAARPAAERGPEEAGRAAAAPSAPNAAGSLATVQEEVRRLNEIVAGLEGRLGGVTDRAARIEQDVAAAKTGLQQRMEALAATAGTAQAGTQTTDISANIAGTKAWLEMELEKMADEIGLTDAQREQARGLVGELMDKYFPKDGSTQNDWTHWGEFQKEWTERLNGLMTSEQKNEYAQYQRKQTEDQAKSSAAWTVSTLDEMVGLNASQRERIREQVKGYYAQTMSQYYGTGSADPTATAESYRALKESIRSELSAEQIPKFDQWFQQYMGGTGGGTSGEAVQVIEAK